MFISSIQSVYNHMFLCVCPKGKMLRKFFGKSLMVEGRAVIFETRL